MCWVQNRGDSGVGKRNMGNVHWSDTCVGRAFPVQVVMNFTGIANVIQNCIKWAVQATWSFMTRRHCLALHQRLPTILYFIKSNCHPGTPACMLLGSTDHTDKRVTDSGQQFQRMCQLTANITHQIVSKQLFGWFQNIDFQVTSSRGRMSYSHRSLEPGSNYTLTSIIKVLFCVKPLNLGVIF